MAMKELVIETGPDSQGIYDRRYAYIIADQGSNGWSWRHSQQQVFHGPFKTEDDAYQDAATKLNGHYLD